MKTRSAYKKEKEQPLPDATSTARTLKFDDPKTPNDGRVTRSSMKKASTEPRPKLSNASRTLLFDEPKTTRQVKKTPSSSKKEDVLPSKIVLQTNERKTPYRKAKANNPYSSVSKQTPQRNKVSNTPTRKAKPQVSETSVKKTLVKSKPVSTPHPKIGVILAPDGSFIQKTPRVNKSTQPPKMTEMKPTHLKFQLAAFPGKAPRNKSVRFEDTATPKKSVVESISKQQESLEMTSPRVPKYKTSPSTKEKTKGAVFSMASPATKTMSTTKLSTIAGLGAEKTLAFGAPCRVMSATPVPENVCIGSILPAPSDEDKTSATTMKESPLAKAHAKAASHSLKRSVTTNVLSKSNSKAITTTTKLTASPPASLAELSSTAPTKKPTLRIVETKALDARKSPMKGMEPSTSISTKKSTADGLPSANKDVSLTPRKVDGLLSAKGGTLTARTTKNPESARKALATPIPPIPGPQKKIASILRKTNIATNLDRTSDETPNVTDPKKAVGPSLQACVVLATDGTGLSSGKENQKISVIKVVPEITKVGAPSPMPQIASPERSVRLQTDASPSASVVSLSSSSGNEFSSRALLSPPFFSPPAFSKAGKYTTTGTPVNVLEDLIGPSLGDSFDYDSPPKTKSTSKAKSEFKKAAVFSTRSSDSILSSAKVSRKQATRSVSPLDGGSIGSFSFDQDEVKRGGDTPLQMFVSFRKDPPRPRSLAQRLANANVDKATAGMLRPIVTETDNEPDKRSGVIEIDDFPPMTIEKIDAELGELNLDKSFST